MILILTADLCSIIIAGPPRRQLDQVRIGLDQFCDPSRVRTCFGSCYYEMVQRSTLWDRSVGMYVGVTVDTRVWYRYEVACLGCGVTICP
jgi:hypothetical protein